MTWDMRTKSKAAAAAKIKSYAQGGPVPDYEGDALDAGENLAGAMKSDRNIGWPRGGEYKTQGKQGPTPQNLRNKQWEDAVSGTDRAERNRKERGGY